jgi:hypothetical protein
MNSTADRRSDCAPPPRSTAARPARRLWRPAARPWAGAYVQGSGERGTPDWYSVLGWTGQFGQLWREGWDIATYDAWPCGSNQLNQIWSLPV